jgi:hypothetical protein
MLKLGIQLKEVDNTLNIQLVDPTKKQLSEATENEKTTADIIKEVLKENLIDLIGNYNKAEKED